MKKIIDYKNLPNEIKKIQNQGKIVLVGGCFDVLHAGHKAFLIEAKKLADTLIVLLESDKSVKLKKGRNRPVNTQKLRASILASIPSVSYIILLPHFNKDEDYYKMTKLIRPDIIAVTSGDPILKIKQDQAKLSGGKVVEVLERIPNISTTNILNR